MSIRVKLYMSYLAMTFVPLILMIAFMLLVFYAGGNQDLRDYSEVQQEEKFNQAIVYGELSYVIRNDSGKLEDEKFMSELQKRLGEQWAGLIIGRNGSVTQIPPFLMQMSPKEDWQKLLEAPPDTLYFQLYRFDSNEVDFVYPDGSAGKLVLLRRTEVVPVFWHPLGFAAMLTIIGLTSLLLTYFVSRSIIRPIKELRTAALQIKDGNLSQQVVAMSDKEIRAHCRKDFNKQLTKGINNRNELVQLSTAFEEMRIRLKHSIDQGLQEEENRKQLLSHISHDLKTPISAIKGYVEGILDGIANTDEKRLRYMQTIYRKATDMDQLIDELFLFSKLDLQTVTFDFRVVDIGRYVEDFMDEQRFDLEKSGIELIYERRLGRAITVAADPDKLNRVLTNVIDNSVKYMGQNDELSKQQIVVRVKEVDQAAVIEIEDTGPVVDSEALPYIFDRFYRAEQSRNSETGGSGLGLAIVKQIIEGHGGIVWAENIEHGGARFSLKLPKATTVRMVDQNEEHSHN